MRLNLMFQHFRFLLENNFVGGEGKTLSDGMSHLDPIVKHLAYLDYCTISKSEGKRRARMYELSLPGENILFIIKIANK